MTRKRRIFPKHSQHLLGKAADIRIKGIDASSLYAYLNAHADRLGFRGIGLYIQQKFVHVDVRETKGVGTVKVKNNANIQYSF